MSTHGQRMLNGEYAIRTVGKEMMRATDNRLDVSDPGTARKSGAPRGSVKEC